MESQLQSLFDQLRNKIDQLQVVSKEAKTQTEALEIVDKIEKIVFDIVLQS